MSDGAARAVAVGEEPIEDIELDLLLEGLVRRDGLDFRGYARQSLRRRVWNMVHSQRLGSISALQEKVLHDPPMMEELLQHLSVNTTTMFRDPSFFEAFRQKVVPHLFSAPFVRIWHAGCSTGEEVYSLAILLTEAGLYERSRIYATDMNASVVERAKSGIFPLEHMREYTANYQRAGGKAAFSDYYTANYDHAIFKTSLRKNIVFAQHNLVSDGTFNEFNVILCRNVLIYFGTDLQARVYRLLHQSLRRFGTLALGRGETLRHTVIENEYDELDIQERLYRRRA
ncbi:protein-glutamate O-methyltransferase CheR [Archangium sp.]|uniref:CheR family methyltransferase n=1 Tax=Archangium sp. TaxID=1872627 RepID=UPI002EDA51A5